jgi:hypothetical protein
VLRGAQFRPAVLARCRCTHAIIGRFLVDRCHSTGRGLRNTLGAFLRHHHSQGLSSRLVTVDELFHPSTFEVAKV